ncbi:nucleotidyltransferase domain-containing protein [Candidatus Woesearchaeota archaeon]|nr:nucleotidyltransferase domain-containing protein [Candidatus Woesearchaeota archaeon]
MKSSKSVSRVLEYLLKDFSSRPTVTSLTKETGLSRVGAWKLIKRMQSGKLIVLYKIGNGKTSAYSMGLNWDNPLVWKNLALCLTENALKNQRWLNVFAELKNKLDFLVLYGSIINSPREASDIDVLGVVSNKSRFVEIAESIRNIQKTQIKKIHAINFTQAELRQELRKPNMAFIGAIKKGIVLFGQEKFIKFMESVARK